MTDATYDTIIIGAGAAGMMCAAHAGARGGRVLVVDHNKAPGDKIRISGGGRCNFTNIGARADHFLSGNRHFAKSALGRYTAADFVALVDRHGIPWHEKILGQLFCDRSAKDIIQLLLDEMAAVRTDLWLQTHVGEIARRDDGFDVTLDDRPVRCRHLVIACGGKSIPKMGATGLGYQVATQFGLKVTETRPALVPFTFDGSMKDALAPLAGVAVDARTRIGKTSFDEALLFTHRGISGPAILQISSYWHEGQPVHLHLLPGQDLLAALKSRRIQDGKRQVATVLGDILPKRLAQYLAEKHGLHGRIGDQSDKALTALAARLTDWQIMPVGTEGYRTAEVTLGGVETSALDAKTLQAKSVPGLYFIGEVVDVTGWLGGYNFQWAWSSGWAAGQAIAANAATGQTTGAT